MRDSADNATQSSEPLAYDLAEAARLLSLGKRKVEYMVKSGELRSIKIGRSRRVPREVLLEYIEQQKQPA
ncbi:helix-turn-helix domain-containing protein [Micromonospora sp. RTGN7]|uniref:helix-turn-helix domain-containing protein n=1 Tax=Micromonospora sp. RTGN7 TaxID=3016526 RepID=UPI0029FEE083|nr:helix-turn-helix domain-containing protein [Micromonospora sp. RTGN7]